MEIKGISSAPLRLCVRSWFVCAVLLLVQSPLSAQQPPKPLRWGADLEGGQPYVYRDPKDPDKIIGFEKDLADALAEELHRPIEFKQYEFDQLLNGLLRRDIDFAMNGMEISAERKKLVRFVRPYYVYHQQLTVRANEERFKTLLTCLDQPKCTIATLSGTAAERWLNDRREKNPGLSVTAWQSPREAYLELERDRADAVYMDAMIAQYYADPAKTKNAGRPTARGYYGIAFRKEDNELADQVDAALGRLMDNNKLRDIYRRWDLWNEPQEELMPGYLFEENDHQGTAVPGSEPEPKPRDQEETAADGTPFWKYLRLLAEGAWVTVYLTVLSFAVAVLLGMPIALARMYGPLWSRFLAAQYVEIFRGLPVMLILMLIYFGLPALGDLLGLGLTLSLDPRVAAVIGLGLNYAAYESEVYRAGLGAIPVGQWEAAASLGMSRSLTFRRIILPQALRQLLPPMTNDLVALFKDTSVASVIAVTELNKEFLTQARSDPSVVIVIGAITAALYLVMSVPLGFVSRRLEKLWTEPST